MKFLMIVVFWYGPSITSQAVVFNSEALCEAAKKTLLAAPPPDRSPRVTREVFCLPFEEAR